MSYYLICEDEIVNGTCPSGFISSQVPATLQDSFTIQEIEVVASSVLYVLAIAYGIRVIKKLIWRDS